jgi:hypothetical protein
MCREPPIIIAPPPQIITNQIWDFAIAKELARGFAIAGKVIQTEFF